jgi:hypothetical protein
MPDQLHLPIRAAKTRRRRLLEQLDECSGFSRRDAVRYIERTLAVAPLQRGRRWARPWEPTFDSTDIQS